MGNGGGLAEYYAMQGSGDLIMKLEAGKFYRTRSGLKARVLCTDAPGDDPCIGYTEHDSGAPRAFAREWQTNGRYLKTVKECEFDLISEWIDEPKTKKVTQFRRTFLCDNGEYETTNWTTRKDPVLGTSPVYTETREVEVEVPVKE